MAKLLKLRRGTTSQHGSFTGAEGEVTVDTDKETLVVHDGSTAGGHPVAAEDMANVSSASIVGRLGAGSIAHAKLAGDAVDGDNIADDSVNSEHYVDASIDHQHLSNDCIDGDNIQDDVINSEHIAAGAVDLEHMSSESVDEDNLKISNAGTNGQFLSKQSGDAGGLTWATPSTTATEATNVTVSANNSTDETVYPTFVDGATGAQGIETDTGLTYNPSTGLLTTAAITTTGNVTVGGNLQVDGTTTTVDSTTMTVADKNIEIAKGAANDAAADGGGITLVSGDGNKTITWTNSTDTWDFNQGIKTTGGITASGSSEFTEDVKFDGSTAGRDITFDRSDDQLEFEDNAKAAFGTGGEDMQIYSDGNNPIIYTGTNTLRIVADNIHLEAGDFGDEFLRCNHDGSVDLYYDNSAKLNTTAAGVTVTGTVTDSKGDVRKVFKNEQSSAYTLVAADSGKAVGSTAGVTIPASVFANGDLITIYNYSGSDITLTQGSGLTMYNTADASTGNRTLAGRGMVTVWFPTATSAYISGSGLS